jgi:hypothetical protein
MAGLDPRDSMAERPTPSIEGADCEERTRPPRAECDPSRECDHSGTLRVTGYARRRFSSATGIPRREKLETGKYARRFKTGGITDVHQLVSTGK